MNGLTQQSTPEARAFNEALGVIEAVEPRVAAAIRSEINDQRSYLKLIASENYASPAVLMTMGNWFSDKYAEGNIGRRFYAGCQNVDTVEALASELACEIFGAPYAYVQPHSGIDANLVAFWAMLAAKVEAPFLAEHGVKHVNDLSEADWETLRRGFGDQRMIGMSLDAGGHLTHGFRPNISGKLFEQRSYGVDPETEMIDYDQVRSLAREFRPLVVCAGYSAYPRKVNFAKMREIADEVDATLMVDMAHFAGLVAGGLFTDDFDPIKNAARRDNHHPQVTSWTSRRHGAGVVSTAKSSLPSSTRVVRWCSVARWLMSWLQKQWRLPKQSSHRLPTTPSAFSTMRSPLPMA